ARAVSHGTIGCPRSSQCHDPPVYLRKWAKETCMCCRHKAGKQRMEPTMTKQKKTTGPGRKKRNAATASAGGPKTKLGQMEGMLRCKEGTTIAQSPNALAWHPQ